MSDAIRIAGVTKRFGSFVAVDDLSLTVPKGAVYGFIGPNGSGKSTTLRMIMNIILPDAGSIEVLGSQDTRAARDRVAYLPEERGLYKKMQVRRLLRYYGQLKGRPRADIERDIDTWLDKLGLAAWGDKKVDALSKGMAQKIQFIAAVIARPELLILDEPFSGLDPVNAVALREAVVEQKQHGTTIVFSTHDMSVAEKMCDRIFMIYRGKKVLDGTLDEIQQSHGGTRVRVRCGGGAEAVRGLPGVARIDDHGQLVEVDLAGKNAAADVQALLKALVAKTSVTHFELARPSLHDIFVKIAQPAPEHMQPAAAAVNVEVASA
jgi:ABC-2 type transport system ATP-binding protein